MQGILFFTFFGYRDYIQDIKESFERLEYNIHDIPYLKYKNDDKLSDNDIIDKIINTVNDESLNITLILFFLLPSVKDFIYDVKKGIKKGKILFYNPGVFNIDFIKYGKGIDYLFTSNKLLVSKMKIIMQDIVGEIIYIPMYSKNYCDVISIKENTDICIIYEKDADKILNTRKIIKDLKIMCIDKDYTIKIIGPPELENIYGDIYEGETLDKSEDSKILFYIRNPLSDDLNNMMNILDLMGKGKILMFPYSVNLDFVITDNINCLLFDIDTYLEKIHYVLANYDKLLLMHNNASKTIQDLAHIDVWTKNIIKLSQN